jgi:integrase
MIDDLSAILETTTAERPATGVQQQLGHASISQTADTYGNVQPERHDHAVNGLDRNVMA